MFDAPATTDPAAAAETPPETGQEDPSPSAEEQDATAAEEEAVWNDVLAEAKGESPPAPEGEIDEEEPEAPAGEAGAEGEDPETPAADAAGAEGQPAEGEEGAEAAAQAAGAEPESEAEIDWGQVDPKVKAAYDVKAKEAARAEHAFKSREGREAALQRKLDAVIAGDKGGKETPAEGEEPANQPSAEEAEAAVKAFRKDWDEFSSNYPEIAEPIGKAFGFYNQSIASLRKESAALRQENERLKVGMQQVGEDRQAAASEVAEQQVLEAHPDVDDIAGTDDFKAWVETQPESIQAIAEANAEQLVDASGVNRLLDLYKLDNGILTNGGRNGASTAEPEPGADTPSDAEPEPGAQKPAASARRRIQRASASAPAPSPGAPAREDDPMQGETEDDVWAQIITAEKRQQRAAEARA